MGAAPRAISGESILRGKHGEGSAGSSAALSESGCDPQETSETHAKARISIVAIEDIQRHASIPVTEAARYC